ncbi:Pyridinium-3,5-bisthiocarboxylic acid mononucleotide nickel insertion protein [Candidatus Entotheonellaceae bacterium PAL068K]
MSVGSVRVPESRTPDDRNMEAGEDADVCVSIECNPIECHMVNGDGLERSNMRIAYVYGSAGVSGSMLLGALLDAGVPLSAVQEGWQRLQLPAAQVAVEYVPLADRAATCLTLTAAPLETFLAQHTYATLRAVLEQRTRIPGVRQRLLQILDHFAAAMAGMHGSQDRDQALCSLFLPMLLYLGSGVAIALDALAIDQVLTAPVNLGAGPHPLTAALVRGSAVYGERASGELTTVDGAAILTGLSPSYTPLPTVTMVTSGHSVPADASADEARGLQVLVGEVAAPATADRITVLEANIDDMNPEFYEVIFERLLAQGALDVMLTPLLMKKGRPANKLTVLARPPSVTSLSRLILHETSTFGVRMYDVWRQKIERFVRQVETCYGVIPVKCGVLDGRIVQAAPEYEACKRAALEVRVPVRLVYSEAARLAASWLTPGVVSTGAVASGDHS